MGRSHLGRLQRLLPHDHPRRGDRPEQAARPQGGTRRLPGLCTRGGRALRGAVPRRPAPG